MSITFARPATDEYGDYYSGYVDRVPDGNILVILGGQYAELTALLHGIDEEHAAGTFAPGEWTIKEVIGHLGDAERLFATRALCFARGEQAPLPGFDQDQYVREGGFGARTLADLLEELALLRRANLITFRRITAEASLRRGIASGVPVSTRAVVYILAGHFIYHLVDLREKYLPALARKG